jgi:uncharacterized protein (TIGR03435 family)
MTRIFLTIGVVTLTGITLPAFPQKTAQTFEAAMFRLENPHSTVDYNRPDAPNQNQTFPSNRLIMHHVLLKSLIANAWGVRSFQYILGGPDWLNSQHYDLSAKVEGNARLTKEEMRPMLKNLLKEHVHLAVHSERRIVPGYALVIAKGGSRLKPNTGAPFFGMFGGFEIKYQNASVEAIINAIESSLKQPVIDKTGMSGTYDFDLIFTRDDSPTDTPHPDYGSIFTAIEKQLGLKLIPEKIPVDYLIIDQVERVPTEN